MEKQIVIASDVEQIPVVETFVEGFFAQHPVDTDLYGNLMVATIEAVTNGIKHGNQLDPNKKVEVSLAIQGDKVILIVKDEGQGFDYNNIPDPTAPENLEKVGGRGVFLMRHLADNVEFNELGNEVKVTFINHSAN